MHNLAVLFAMGADGAADNESAARWFTQAAELGVKDSQFNLGILAAKGVGMPQNLEESYKWFALVAKTGDKDAAAKRDEIAKALRPSSSSGRAPRSNCGSRSRSTRKPTRSTFPSLAGEPGTTASIDMKKAIAQHPAHPQQERLRRRRRRRRDGRQDQDRDHGLPEGQRHGRRPAKSTRSWSRALLATEMTRRPRDGVSADSRANVTSLRHSFCFRLASEV